MFCRHCGQENPENSNFCSGCGESITYTTKPNLTKTTGHLNNNDSERTSRAIDTNDSDVLLSAFVGEKYSSYYREKWFKGENATLKAKKGSDIFSFNLAGMLLGVFWLCYRKMYAIAVLVAVLIPMVDIIRMHTKGEVGYGSFDDIAYGLMWIFATGVLGNMLYHHYSAKKIVKVISETTDPLLIRERLMAQGGTTWAGAIIGGTVTFLIIISMYGIFAPSWY